MAQDEDIRRLTRAMDKIVDLIRDDNRRFERALEELRMSIRDLGLRMEAMRVNDVGEIADKLRFMTLDIEKAAFEQLDKATFDRLRKMKWQQEQETGVQVRKIDYHERTPEPLPPPPEIYDDGITASKRGLKFQMTWGLAWSYGKWIFVGGAGWLIHHVQQLMHW